MQALSSRAISRNLKLEGIDKCLEGVNMRKEQIDIKNIKQPKKITLYGGGVLSLNWRGGLKPS